MEHIAVYICSDLSSKFLRQSIESVLALALPSETRATLVLVLNTAESPKNLLFARELEDDYRLGAIPICVIFEPEKGIPAVRNRALTHARQNSYGWVAFLDDDCVAEEDWLRRLIECALNTSSDAVMSSWSIEPKGSEPSRWIPSSVWGPKSFQLGPNPVVSGQILPYAYTRAVLVNLKNKKATGSIIFDTSRASLGGSDVAFFWEYSRAGGKIVYCQESHVTEYYSGERLMLRWHFFRKVRNAQFIMERATGWGEQPWIPLNISGLFFALAIALAGGKVRFYRRPFRFKMRRFSVSPSVLGALAMQAGQAVGAAGFMLGLRHHNYHIPKT